MAINTDKVHIQQLVGMDVEYSPAFSMKKFKGKITKANKYSNNWSGLPILYLDVYIESEERLIQVKVADIGKKESVKNFLLNKKTGAFLAGDIKLINKYNK
jgi:hypothetical protein